MEHRAVFEEIMKLRSPEGCEIQRQGRRMGMLLLPAMAV